MIEAARRRTKADVEGDGDDDDDNNDDDDDGAMLYDGRIAVEVGDATDPPPGPCDVVFSAFGLQQLPHPMSAALTWIDRLGGGCASSFIGRLVRRMHRRTIRSYCGKIS